MGVLDVWLLLYIPFQVYIRKLTYRAYTMSDVVNPALADASSFAWEFSSALLANPR